MTEEPIGKAVNARLEEMRKKMKGIKRIVVRIEYNFETKEMTVKHSPKTRFDPEFILGMLATSIQWLSADWTKQGLLEIRERKKEPYIT